MTDTFEVQGDFSPAENLDVAMTAAMDTEFQPEAASVAEVAEAPMADAPAAEEAHALPNGFVRLGLAPELVRAVEDLGYTQPTAVQDKAIPLAMQGEDADAKFIDLMVSSQTGSGKTAAFLLPVLHTLLRQQAEAEKAERDAWERIVAEAAAKGEAPPKRPKRKNPTDNRHFKAATPGALILCPTRELAQQVAHDAIGLVQHCKGLRIANVVGGIPYQLQIARLQNANLVVATPGRLLDLQRSMQIKLDQVQFLVVDEADRMLDLGFSDDLAEINQLTAARKQTMMFSATFASRIQQLASRVMREPQKVTIDTPQEKHVNIKQVLFWADNTQHKRKLLDHWLRDASLGQAIVFASTQVECDGLANDLQQEGFSAVALHGALSQGLRNRRLMALRNGQVQILVATDVAARGIDVPSITHVFNFGLPMKAEDYTHRIGRTGRAGRDGTAVTIAEFRDRRKIFDIEAYSRQQFKAEVIPGLEPTQRFPSSRPPGSFDRGPRENHSRDRKFGGGGNRGGNFGGGGGFGEHRARGPRIGGGSYHQDGGSRFGGQQDNGGRFGGQQDGGARFGGQNDNGPRFGGRDDRFGGGQDRGFDRGGDRRGDGQFAGNPFDRKAAGGGRNEAFGAPRGGFSDRKPAGKVFVPRDAGKKKPYKPAR